MNLREYLTFICRQKINFILNIFLCQFLNIPIIYHHVKNQKKLMSHPDKNAELIDGETTVILQDPQQHRNRSALKLICKYLGDHLPGNNLVSSSQQLPIFNTDKDWPHFNDLLQDQRFISLGSVASGGQLETFLEGG